MLLAFVVAAAKTVLAQVEAPEELPVEPPVEVPAEPPVEVPAEPPVDEPLKELGEPCGWCPGGSDICGPSTGEWYFGDCAPGLECLESDIPDVLGTCEYKINTDENGDTWSVGIPLYQDAPTYVTLLPPLYPDAPEAPIDVEARADARRKAAALKVREARVKARAETVAKSPVE